MLVLASQSPRRAEILYRVAELLKARKDELGRLVTMEMGKVLMEARLRTPISNGIIAIGGLFDPGEIVEVANRLATDGRIEVNAIERPRR